MKNELRISSRDRERFESMSRIEAQFRLEGCRLICGVDEAGRGPLAGPVAAAACVLNPEKPIYGLNDSKKLSEKRRELLFDEIREKAISYQIAFRSHFAIDESDILKATKEAMLEAIHGLKSGSDLVLLDALRLPELRCPQRAYIGGDAKVNAIAAASILAKVSRDRQMRRLAEIYPHYGFERNKGYGTTEHYAALREAGPSPVHRLSFLSKLQLGKCRAEAEISKDDRRQLGFAAEARVAEHLRQQGFHILAQNYQLLPLGEIDLIAESHRDIFIIEVRARSGGAALEEALQSVDRRKIRRLKRLAAYFAQSRALDSRNLRVLIAACALNSDAQVEKIKFTEIEA